MASETTAQHATAEPDFLQYYQNIADVSGKMLQSAYQQDWQTVTQLSTDYANAVERLRQVQPLNTRQRQARKTLLLKILDNDARIRKLAQPELDRLGKLISYGQQQKNALNSYGMPQTHS